MADGDCPCAALVHVVDGNVQLATIRIDGVVPDLFVVDAIVRLELAARQLGWSVRLPGATERLRALLVFVGLADVVLLPPPPTSEAADRTRG